MSQPQKENDPYMVDGHDLYLIKGTDSFRLYGWSGRDKSIQMIEAVKDVSFGNHYHQLTEKIYAVLAGEVEFYGQHIDEHGQRLGLTFTRNISVGHTREVKTGMAHALCLKAGAKIICRINRPLGLAKADRRWHEVIKASLLEPELNNELI